MTDNAQNCDSYTVKVWCIILTTDGFCYVQKIIWGKKECRCFVRGEWHVFPFSKGAYNRNAQPAYSGNLMTAASYKWRTTSHFTLHNSGTEEFLI
jgi:hypothetical protein